MGSIIRDSIQSVGTAKKLGWGDVTFVGQAASYDPIVAAAPGGIMEGFYSATGLPYAYADSSPEPIKAWAAKYKSRTNQDPNTAAQYGYVIGDIVVKALEASGKDLTRPVAAMKASRTTSRCSGRCQLCADKRQHDGELPRQGGRRSLEGGGREPDVRAPESRA
jgi:hypothetical protein